jgi:hypothetical protein
VGSTPAGRSPSENAVFIGEIGFRNALFQEQEATNAQLKKNMETFVTRLKEQASLIQKVSAQLELSKPATRTVLNGQ